MFKILSAIWFSGFVGYASHDMGLFKGLCFACFVGIPMVLAFFAGIEVSEEKK